MENYIKSNEAGDMYVRPKAISLINPNSGIKSISYFIESIVNLKDGSIIESDMGATTGYFTEVELAKIIKLYNPLTMEELGEKPISELFDLINTFLFSYMVHLRNPAPLIPVELPLPETEPDGTYTP